jgi:hypothetical protein
MKYIISESQHKRLREFYNDEEENNVLGNPSDDTLMVADFFLRYDLVDPRSLLITDCVVIIWF